MKSLSLIFAALFVGSSSLVAFQNRGIPGIFHDDDDEAPVSSSDFNQKTAEWTFARLHYDLNGQWGGF